MSHASDQLAVRLHGPRDLRVERVDVAPAPGPGEVRVRVCACGICGSDVHLFQDGRIGDTALPEPLVPGHEFAGVVEDVGPGVALERGARVAVDPLQPCGTCEMCRLGHPNLCLSQRFCGLPPTPGAMQERLTVPAATCHAVPDCVSDDQAAMLEPLGVALHAVDLAHVRAGMHVAVLGAGPIGLLVQQVALLAGAARVFTSEQIPARLAMAQQLGGQAVDAQAGDPVAAVRQTTAGRGVDVAIECAWSGQTALQACEMLRPGGRLVVVGIPGDDRFELRHSTARRRGLTIAFCRRMKHVYPRAIELVASRRVLLDPLVTHRLPLREAPQGFSMLDRGEPDVVKIMLHSSA